MATRKNTFLLKRSNVAGNIPTAGQILLGELALNTADVKLYASGTTTNSIIPIGWDRISRTGDTMTGTLYVPTISATTYQNLPNDLPISGTTGQILAKNSNANYDVTWIDNYTSQLQHTVKAGVAITKGQAVYVTGADGTNMIVGLASNTSEATSSKTLGLLAQDLALNGQGFVITEGLLAGLNTGTATAGDPVWLGINGNLIFGLLNKPIAPAHLVYIGVVTRAQTVNGEIFVKPQNGFEFNELHDVLLTGVTNGDLVSYNSATSLWRNTKTLNGSYNVTGTLSANTISATTITANTFTGLASLATSATTALNADLLDGQHGSYYYPASNPNGYTTNTGTVTSVSSGNGMNFSNFTNSGTITLGTPSSTTLVSTNATTTNSHTHAFAPGGTTAQYISGAGTLITFPTIPTVNNGTLTLATSGIATGSASFTANQSGASTFTVDVPATNLSIGVSSGTQVRVDSSTGTDVDIPVASATLAGIITTGAQTFAGTKTFSSTINGSINGSAASATDATNASYVAVTDDATTNANFYVTFSNATNTNSRIWTDSARLYYNPSTDTLYASNLNGNASNATQAVNATNVGVTNDTTTNGNFYLTFSPGAGNQPLKIDSAALTFNPSTNTLTVPNLSGLASLATSATTALNSTNTDKIDNINFRNSDSTSPITAADTLDSNAVGYVNNINLFGQTDGALYAQAYSSVWQHQIFGDYRTGQLAVRGKNNGTWQAWRSILDSTNFTNYAVPTSRTLTINGVTQDLSANRSWTISGSGGVTGSGTASYIPKFTGTTAIGNSLIYDNGSGIGIDTTSPGIYKLNVNGAFNATSVQTTGAINAGSFLASSTYVSAGSYGQFRGDGTGDKVFIGDPFSIGPIGVWDQSTSTDIAVYDVANGQFQYSNRNIRCDIASGYVSVGGSPTGSGRFEVIGDNGGNVSIYATNDIIAFSDISIKENLRPIENVLDRVTKSRGVLYDRTDNNAKDNIGFVAQELEGQFPELVTTNPDGTKAVKYQNATAVLFEAVKEQQKQIDSMQEQINKILENYNI